MKKKAVVLVSGGLDSITVLALAKSQGFELYPLSFFYAQSHKLELEKARASLESMGINNHKIMHVDIASFGNSALTDPKIKIPKYDSVNDIKPGVPITYVPARNTIFLSFALAYAEILGAEDIFIGAHILDSGNYPDCKKEFLESFELAANIAIGGDNSNKKIRINAPLIEMTKSEIISLGHSLGVDFSNTISCYDPSEEGESCGKCLACTLRLDGFKKAGLTDSAIYIH
ncbi:MAG: 7-cyano-7-deazaguanine synthase QueC [Rickettsiaceae bacterium]|nr:7-cyano-7-deazaguanine synthase QueC [Rickettsiaceae bacterium]